MNLRPVLEPQDPRGRRILDLEPCLAGAGSVGVLPVLRDDALVARVLEDGRAVSDDVLVEL
jgi:hypothetical protein